MKYSKIQILFLLTLFCTVISFADPQATTNYLVGARLWQNKNTTQIIFEFEKKFDYKEFSLTKPYRTVIDLPYTALKTNLNRLPISQSIIKDIRIGHPNSKTLRLVLDLKEAAKIKTFPLGSKGNFGYRLVVNLTGPHVHSVDKPKPIYEAQDTIGSKAIEGRNIIVVVDPGHGGKDPGATGPRGIHEKNVVLAISKDIQKDIDAIPGMTTLLTRYGDYYITLRDRLQIARKDHADFFVAIHADAFHDKYAKGASVFALSQRGATSEAARWLAEKENYSELGGVDLANKSRMLRSVLIDLSQTATIRQSLTVGNKIVHQLAEVTPMHSYEVEQARFVVLKSPDIPSLLIETGFISNPKEETLLSSTWYRVKLAKAITAGIKAYFWSHPPPDTLFALEKNAVKHMVKKDETISQIAKHYKISVNLLRRMNGLKSNVLHVGEVLLVPRASYN